MRYFPYHAVGLGWGAWVLGILLTIAFWGLLITALIWLIRSLRRPGPRAYQTPPAEAGWRTSGPAAPQAEQILAERFARGEIDETEYRTRLATLRGGPGVPPNPPASASA